MKVNAQAEIGRISLINYKKQVTGKVICMVPTQEVVRQEELLVAA
jgi:hypothetical protein